LRLSTVTKNIEAPMEWGLRGVSPFPQKIYAFFISKW